MSAIVHGCSYPTNAELMQVMRDLMPRYERGRVGLEIMPTLTSDRDRIVFNMPDIFRGLQQWRGLGKPSRQTSDRLNPFGKNCEVQPGYWGEHDVIDEELLTRGVQPATCAAPLDLTEHMTNIVMRLLERRYNRIEYNIWQALAFGRYEALNELGQVVLEQAYNVTTISSAVPWSTSDTSTPMNDLRVVQLLGRGTSADFGSMAVAYMNRVTANCLFRNTNRDDVGRVGLSACCTFMGPDQVNQQFAAQGLPQISIYDQGYVGDDRTFYPYIPNGRVVIVGTRPGGERIGNYRYTRNAVGCAVSSGPWVKTIDTCNREVVRKITVADGHNGGPALWYPRAVVVLETGCA